MDNFKVLIFASFTLFFVFLITAYDVPHRIPVQIQVENYGTLLPGTYTFTINFSTASDCSAIIYNDTRILTTDSRAIVTYDLENVDFTIPNQLYLCYYRDGVLKANKTIGSSIYALKAGNGFGTYRGATANQYSGNITNGTFSGYYAMEKICSLEYNNSHVCSVEEMLYTIKTQNVSSYTKIGWIIGGNPGYTATANDCESYTSSTLTSLGRFWDWTDRNDVGGKGWLTACSSLHEIFCCS